MNFPDSESFLSDYEALSNGKGFLNLENWSTVTMTGEDRRTFLHNMCTNDIKRLTPGDSCEAFCTDVKGKIVAHVFVIVREDRLDLLTVPEQAEVLIAHLDRYIIREDVTLVDATADFEWMLVGKKAVHPAIISKGLAGLLGDLLSVAASKREETENTLIYAGIAKCDHQIWSTLRIEAGLPLFGVDFDSTHLPQEVNRDEQAISFNKGCYLGQETIARIDALGHVNQQVVLVQFSGETVPTTGLELNADGKGVGQVTSSCWSPKLKTPLSLAMVRRGSNASGTILDSELGQATVVESAGC